MNFENKTKTSLAIFDEFFAKNYKDELFEVLQKYPEERSLVIDFNDLEIFDPNLANLLIEKPDEVILASQKAISNITNTKLNARFKNLTNEIPLKHLLSPYIGTFISTKGIIKEVRDFRPRIETAVFECRSCMRLSKVKQNVGNNILEPSLCAECGGRSFRLLQDESKYIDTQSAIISDFREELSEREDLTELLLVFEDDLIKKLRVGDYVNIVGTLLTFRKKSNGKLKIFLYVNHIEYLDLSSKLQDFDFFEDTDQEDDGRNNAEYNIWRQQVLARDNYTCQCCGDTKYPHVHHIFNYKHYDGLRTDVDNGITLCQWCHNKYHSHYGKESNPVTLMEFLKRFGGVILKTSIRFEKENPNINYSRENSYKPVYSSETSLREEINYVYESMKELESYNHLPISFEAIREKCNYIEDDALKNILRVLKSKGLIFEFRQGSYMINTHQD